MPTTPPPPPSHPAPQSSSSTTSQPVPPSAPVRWHWGSALAGALIAAILLGGALLIWRRPAPAPIVLHAPPTPVVPTPEPTATPAPLMIFVSGAVQQPGVYALTAGARVVDALAAAGGFAPDANVDVVNQAAPMHDGDQIHVPTIAEEATEPQAGIAPRSEIVSIDSVEAASGLINVNTATAAELESLPGIGPARAEDIIANRPYATVDDLERVPGIGPATLEELRPYVVVE